MDLSKETVTVTGLEAAHANEYFEQFVNATSMKNIFGYYRGLIDNLHLRPNVFTLFYPKLKANLTSWRAKALLKKFDSRASHKCYQKGKLAANTRVLVIGGGPCGLRTAIEAQLLGAKVVVIEKRDRFSRNNVLHLWPFVIEDLRMLGAKKFFGKFCAGAIDHISIRQLQCILLKVALLLGVEIHTEVSFENLIEPDADKKIGWRAEFKPSNHPVSQYEFDVIIGADGKRNTLQGFTRKEFRGKLAIAITANFINKKTEAEARVEEISGVAFIFNQKFFKDLQEATRIDLENIVYYKDDTHYFVMTAKKHSLIEKGVIKQDFPDTERLLAPENVDKEALQQYAIEAASFSTNYQMPNLEFAVNHYGQPDIAMFDFTSMYAAENASKVVERNGYRLLKILVGDSLLEPFWPTGSGCARGFLSSLDAAWAIRSWSLGTVSPLDTMAERESIYRLLAQTTPDNLNKDWKSYTLDPATRYPNLNKTVVVPHQVVCLYDTDNPASIERMKRSSNEKPNEIPKKRRRGNIDSAVLLSWLVEQLKDKEGITITDMGSAFKDGKVLCAIINHYRPDLLDYSAILNNNPAVNNQIAIDILEKDFCIPPVMTGSEFTVTEDYLTMATYLTEIYDCFRGEIPYIKQPKLELPPGVAKIGEVSFKTIKTANTQTQTSRPSSRHRHKHGDVVSQKVGTADKKPRKRRTNERIGISVEERQKMLEEIAFNRTERQNKRRYQRKLQTEQFLKSMQMLQANAKPDSRPFEDYSIFLYRQTAAKFEDRVKDLEKQFTYIPDHENKPNQLSRNAGRDEDIEAKIKDLENKWRQPQPVDKKPKDLLRAIGKIETSDWNIKEIEKKIMENKMGRPSKAIDKEKIPKWSKEKFLARQTKMEKQHLDRQNSSEAKFADIDRNIKNLDQKLKEGTARELGTRKVATITEKLVRKIPTEPKPPEKNTSRQPLVLPKQVASEFCHFCNKRVYLMERLSAEGRFFHHGCFKCQYCHIQLRLGSYAFDRDGFYGYKFFCLQHFGMVGEAPTVKINRKPSVKRHVDNRRSPEKKPLTNVTSFDAIDKVQTPERIEFSNLSTGHISSDQEDSLNQMDEDEWTDKNFGGSCAELDDTDIDSSSISDTDSDDEDAFDDALEEPATKEGTLKWAERWKNSYSRKHSDSNEYSSSSDQSSYYDSSDDDESETATEGEEEIRARELRKQEVCVEPPVVHTDTGTDTEIVSDESGSESSNDVHNSATEISTDSEFAQDDPTPTRELPAILLNDVNVTKTRGSASRPKKIHVTSRYLQKPSDGKAKKPNIELKLTPLVQSVPRPTTLARPEGYVLNRTQSTGGIAAKVSLELKKKYLLGDPSSTGGIQKSGSASTLDTKFKSFQTNISDCQKLLKPSTEVSTGMQTFCKKLDELKSPVVVTEEIEVNTFENESEGRPRSPLYETSIVVPQIDWNKQTERLTSDSLASSESDDSKPKPFENIPRVEISTAEEVPEEEFLEDSLHYNPAVTTADNRNRTPSIETPKSVTGDKKVLNQPKPLPNLENLLPEIHNSLHIKYKNNITKEPPSECGNISSPESATEQNITALTETELSDWARDDFEDGEFEIRTEPPEKPKRTFPEFGAATEATNNILSVNLDNIEFMDTGTETSSDDGVGNSQTGYVLFKNEDEFAIDSLNPVNDILEAKNVRLIETKEVVLNNDQDDDSVAIIESGTTTEENTVTESTVKNVEPKTPVNEVEPEIKDNIEFHEHIQRLKSKVEFSNAKDSIDVRKSRRKSKPDLLSEELASPKMICTPDILYNKEIIKKERDTNQRLIQEMVMNKMKAENKSLERKKRNSRLPDTTTRKSLFNNNTQQQPDVLPITNSTSQNINTVFINSEVTNKEDGAPKAPPRYNNTKSTDEMDKKLERLKQTVRLRNKENEHLMLNKEQMIVKKRGEKCIGLCISGNYEPEPRATSIPEFPRKASIVQPVDQNRLKTYKSDPNILETVGDKGKRTKEHRRSLTKFITGLFTKISPNSNSSKGLFSKLSPKSKDISKSCANLGYYKEPEVYQQRKSLSENFINRNATPPPVPPLPTNYVRKTDDSSDVEDELKNRNDSSCDTLDFTGASAGSTNGRRSSKNLRTNRKAQLKRHRMAQEIQRKLEETEVKMKELEVRGVSVEKALRGEGIDSTRDESELLQEWFDLMRDRTELRRYERELTVRAQELELEDRHARLQHELRERIEIAKPKTETDVEAEESIINEMIKIVEKRDSLIAEMEEDKIRYSHENRDLEEQMLAKGLRLTSVKCSPEH